jgi:hypothetical protein
LSFSPAPGERVWAFMLTVVMHLKATCRVAPLDCHLSGMHLLPGSFLTSFRVPMMRGQ